MALTDVQWAQAAQQKRDSDLERYKDAWAAYAGEMADTLKRLPDDKFDDNVKVNFVRLVVDKGVAALFGREIVFDLDAAQGARSPAEQWLDACWQRNRKMIFLQKVALNGAIFGHPFIKFRLPEPGGFPRLINIPPEYVTVVGDPNDIDAIEQWLIEYTLLDADNKAVDVRQRIGRDDGGRWVSVDERRRKGGRWEIEEEILWPYDWPPMIDCQNLPNPNEYYGLPDVGRDVLQLNHAINFVLSNMQRIIRFHAHPKTWGKGATLQDLKIAVDGLILFNNPDGELHNLEMQNDLTSSIAYYTRLREALHEVTRIPEVATGKMENVGQLSGVALRILYGPLVEKTQAKQLTYGEMLVEMNRRLLEMGGLGAENVTTIQWPALVPANEMQERQVAALDEQLGVSRATLLTRLGFDPDREAAQREQETQSGGALVGAVMDAMRQGIEA